MDVDHGYVATYTYTCTCMCMCVMDVYNDIVPVNEAIPVDISSNGLRAIPTEIANPYL